MTLLAGAPLVQAEKYVEAYVDEYLINSNCSIQCKVKHKKTDSRVNLGGEYLGVFNTNKILVRGIQSQMWIPKHRICPSAKPVKISKLDSISKETA